jgi:hypothetical protein
MRGRASARPARAPRVPRVPISDERIYGVREEREANRIALIAIAGVGVGRAFGRALRGIASTAGACAAAGRPGGASAAIDARMIGRASAEANSACIGAKAGC